MNIDPIYSSYGRCTRNENGRLEINFTYKNGLFRSLFKMDQKIEVYEFAYNIWRVKSDVTAKVGALKVSEIEWLMTCLDGDEYWNREEEWIRSSLYSRLSLKDL